MQYKYRFETNPNSSTEVEFDDFFAAIQFMNKHSAETVGIKVAEILESETHKVVCSRRVIQ